MIGLLRSNLGIVLFRKFPLVRPRFIYSEKSWLIRIQLPKGFLGLRIVECKNSSDLLEWGLGATDRKHHTHSSQSFGYLHVPIAAGNHRLSVLVHLSSLHHHSLRSIHFKLLSCWVESTHPFAERVADSRPSVLL